MLRSIIVCGTLFASTAVQAATFAPITFSTSTDYTGNFNSTSSNTSRFAYDNTNQLLRYANTTVTGTQTVQYTPSSNFLTETLSYDTSFSGFNSAPSSGIMTRIQSTGAAAGTGILALINSSNVSTTTNTSLQMRLFYNVTASTGTVGTAFYDHTFTTSDATYKLARAIATNSNLHVTLTQTDAADPVFNLSVSDATGVVATTGDIAFTTNDNYNTAGGIALRASSSYAGMNITFDNLTATPEPAALGLLCLGGLALRRRRKA